MQREIERAIYYTGAIPSHYSGPIAAYEYHDKESFKEIVSTLNKNVEVVALFAPQRDNCYKIFSQLKDCYETLLFEKITSLFLVNRKDFCIQLVKKSDDDEKIEKVAILKIDAVLSERPEIEKKTYLSYFYSPTLFVTGALAGITLFICLKND